VQSPSKMARDGGSTSRERKSPTSYAGGVGSHFPPSLPSRLSALFSNTRLATARRVARHTTRVVQNQTAMSKILTVSWRCRRAVVSPASSQFRQPQHQTPTPSNLDDLTYAGPSKSTILPTSLSTSMRQSKPISLTFLKHHTLCEGQLCPTQ
jgi:hypothetical protein